MAQYQREISKWLNILIDKVFIEHVYDLDDTPFTIEESHVFFRIEDGMSEEDFYDFYKVNRKDARKSLLKYMKEGCLKKELDPLDRRKRILKKTLKGRLLTEKWESELEGNINRVLMGLTVNEEISALKFISKLYQLRVEKPEIKK